MFVQVPPAIWANTVDFNVEVFEAGPPAATIVARLWQPE
jgi:hypothetical protein